MIITKFYPNGEFTQGIDTSANRKKTSTKVSPPPPSPSSSTVDAYLQWQKDNADIAMHLCTEGNRFSNGKGIYTYLYQDCQGYHYAYECRTYVLEDVVFLYPPGYMIALGLWAFHGSPLVYQTVESSPSTENDSHQSRKVLESMTKNMARNIRNGVYLLEQQCGKDNLSFRTLTIPQLCEENHRSILENWARCTDQILKWLRKKVTKFGIQFSYVYCTEIQGKRYERTGYIAPHLHIVFAGRKGKKSPWCITPKQVRSAWASILRCFLSRDEKFETKALENLQRIKYSAARYLSKYMSKSACSFSRFTDGQNKLILHTQWGGMDRTTSQRIKRATARLSATGNLREVVLYFCNNYEKLLNDGFLAYYREGHIPIGISPHTGMERFLRVGCGCLTTPTYEGGLSVVIQHIEGILVHGI